MTTTAHEDQFTTAPEPIRQPYDTAAILRRNIAALELALRTQTERAESYAETLRSLASYVGAGGYNSDTVDAGVFEEKIRWGIGEIMERTKSAEAEMTKLAQQDPVAWMLECQQWTGDTAWLLSWSKSGAGQCNRLEGESHQRALYTRPIPAPAPAMPYGIDEEAANRIALAVYDCKNGINQEPLLYAINRILATEAHPLSAEGQRALLQSAEVTK